jgi:hypothetical protein
MDYLSSLAQLLRPVPGPARKDSNNGGPERYKYDERWVQRGEKRMETDNQGDEAGHLHPGWHAGREAVNVIVQPMSHNHEGHER